MGRSRAGKSSESKKRRYQAGETIRQRNKKRREDAWKRARERWANDKEYQAKQKERAIRLGRING